MTIVSPAPKPVSTSPQGTAPPEARAWYVLAALCFVYVLNFLDRQLLSILAKPIQDDLGVSDGQLGLISGLYFALFYCFISIPVAWLADRTNRVRVLSIACALWSAATVACGLSATYPQLVLARMTVGVGEAGGVPPSYAIITDYFRPGRRGAALGLFNLGPPLGQALGVAFGASYSWRQAFLVLGMFGVAAALIVWLTIREPKRGGLDLPASDALPAQARAGFLETVAMFFKRPALLLMALACGATQFVTYAVMNFTVLFLMREKGMSLQQVAVYYALLIGIGISIGMYTSGRLVDRFSGRSRQAYALVPALGLAGAVPLFVGFVWAPGWQLALLLLIGPTILNYFFLSPAVTLVQEEVRPNQRVLSGALLLLVMNLIGLGFGPTYLGAASDHFRTAHPGNSLQLAFYTLVPFYFLAIALFLALARVLKAEANRTGDH
ncbi:putative MFS family arabinose efflux permease [Nitrospirillum amazonense]|uniref:Putative MFS family arabinose efflux permease n=1 Tax=Nitrospirillum amazonense TaxID=28077 RepID=A0A560JF78_9PROT|nr:MFS transporter [Nitrospirillum amazonense]TWB69169.1 putative MFS family arabinose efflux permease [Nitrospirillum amazonense]